MGRLKALLWDVDGTIAETERDGHRVAFNLAFEAFGLPWRWDEARYGRLLRVTGGRERLLFDMATRHDAPVLSAQREELARALHERKNALYAQMVREARIPARPGVLELMSAARAAGVRMGIATTTTRSNVEALLGMLLGTGWASWFDVLVCGEDVRSKKPDPEVYLRALDRLDLSPLQAVALEDSPGGVAAARAAEIPVVVTRSSYFADAVIDDAIAIGPGLDRREGWRPALPHHAGAGAMVGLADLEHWLEQMDSVSQHA